VIGTAAQLAAAFALRTEVVELRGEQLNVRELSAGARAEVLTANNLSQSEAAFVTVLHCLVDDKGAPIYGKDQMELIRALHPDVIDAVAGKALSISGLRGSADPKG
jgi:hypothetical protein